MKTMQKELTEINSQIETLTHRKTQVETIISEYSKLTNGIKNLIELMESANVDPTNLYSEIEDIIFEVVAAGIPGDDDETEPETPPNSEPVRLMALIPTVAIATPETTPETIKTQLNNRAYRRNDTLLIGFDNKRLMNSWEKWIKDNWGDSVHISSENLDGFKYCLSVLWYGSDISTNWERLTALDYSCKPDEQPTGINLDNVRNVIVKLQNSGVKFVSKGELLAHHFNSLKASDLEKFLEKLVEEGLIALGDKSIDLCTKPSEQKQDNPTFEYVQVDAKTTKIYADGMLLGIAKDYGTDWESPQLPGQTFLNRRDVVAALWELVNKF